MSSGSHQSKVSDVIESLGPGQFLVNQTILGAGIWVASGSQLIIITAVTLVIAREWGLTGWQRSATVSVVFLGKMIGNFVSGPCVDTVGRRLPIVAAYCLVSVFSGVAAFAPGFMALCTARFVLGLAFGMAQTAWAALSAEITPADWRMIANIASSIMFIVGEIYAGYLVWFSDPQLENLAWRWLTVAGAAPALVVGLAAVFFLKESASWLALRAQYHQAREVLLSMQWWNGKAGERIDFTSYESSSDPVTSTLNWASVRQQVALACGPALRYTTCALCFTCFVLNFVYYGGFYAFPLVLGNVDMGASPAVALFVGIMWELPGYFAAALCSMFFSRRVSIIAYLILMACSTIMFVRGAVPEMRESKEMLAQYLVHIGYAGMKCWINMGFVIVYQYTAEVYPTCARAAGTGLCIGCGRLGSIFVPFVFEAMAGMFNDSWIPFFYTMAILCAVNTLLIMSLPFETWGVTLKDHVDEMNEAEPLTSCGARKLFV